VSRVRPVRQTNHLARKLARLLGEEQVASDSETLAVHAADKWFASRLPDAVVLAATTEHVSKNSPSPTSTGSR
jgi:hypothetical protein